MGNMSLQDLSLEVQEELGLFAKSLLEQVKQMVIEAVEDGDQELIDALKAGLKEALEILDKS